MGTPHVEHNGRNIAFDPVSAAVAAQEGGDITTTMSATDFIPVRLDWEDLTFDVPRAQKPEDKKKEKKGAESEAEESDDSAAALQPPVMSTHPDNPALSRVLHENSGLVKPGEMLAVIGSSGAGKSTLLNLLAGRIKSSKGCVSGGRILVNGARRDFSSFTGLAAYVEQDDTMFGELTVYEQIRYAAMLRLPSSMSKERKLQKVERIIQELGLQKCRDTYIGNAFVKGVSGGERKRCSIGMEMVTDPSLLICDEPTTGLDSFSALNVMTTLRHLASNGRTVIATIHQPRSSIFALFDKLCVLSEGRTVYFGPADGAADYYNQLGFQSPSNFNVADYVIDAVSIDYRSKTLETNTKKRVLYLAGEHKAAHPETLENAAAELEAAQQAAEEAIAARGVDDSKKRRKKAPDAFQNTWVGEFVILLQRTLLKLTRETMQTTVRLIQSVVFGLLLGVVWLNTGRELDEGSIVTLQSVGGVLFFLAVNAAFDGSFSVIFDFVLLKAVLTRERASSSYRISSFYFASMVVDILKAVVLNGVFVTIVYWMVGLRANAGAYFFAILTVILCTLTGEAYSQAISVLTGDAQITSALVPLALVLAFLFAGFFIGPSALPPWIRWGRFCSFLYWGYEALAHNDLDFRNEPGVEEYVEATFNDLNRWANLGVLFAFCVAFKSLYFIILSWKRPKFEKEL